MRAVLLILMVLWSGFGFSQSKQDYIYTYADIAVREMERAKIPASITLAQGILESRFGTSELSSKSNNHFGIKCHKGWQGESVSYTDDAPNECFRKYHSADESFRDHSAFLSKRGRYSDLFKLSIYDYKGWAKGLRKAGYATNPKYADHLIKIIEDEQLYVFDRMSSREVGPYIASLQNYLSPNHRVVVEHPTQKHEEPQIVVQPQVIEVQGGPATAEEVVVVAQSRDIFIDNKVKTVFSFHGDTPAELAKLYGIPLKKLYKYNEWPQYLNEFTWGMKVYLQPKKSKSKEVTALYHTVKPGETMYQIAQQYGIVTEKLYERNRMNVERADQPRVGEVISLKGKSTFKPLLRLASDTFTADQMEQQSQDEAVKITSEEAKPTPQALPSQKRPIIRELEKQVVPATTMVDSKEPITDSTEDIWATYPSTNTGNANPSSKTTDNNQYTNRSIIYDPTPAVNQQPVRRYTPPPSRTTSQSTTVTKPEPIVVTTSPTTSPASTITHTVIKGDTLWGLSQKYKVTVDKIKAWNNLNNNSIKVGQKLIVSQ